MLTYQKKIDDCRLETNRSGSQMVEPTLCRIVSGLCGIAFGSDVKAKNRSRPSPSKQSYLTRRKATMLVMMEVVSHNLATAGDRLSATTACLAECGLCKSIIICSLAYMIGMKFELPRPCESQENRRGLKKRSKTTSHDLRTRAVVREEKLYLCTTLNRTWSKGGGDGFLPLLSASGW